MKYKIEQSLLSEAKVDVACILVWQGKTIAEALAALDGPFAKKQAKFVAHIAEIADEDSFKGKAGQFFNVLTYERIPSRRIIFSGLGVEDCNQANAVRKLAANLARRVGKGVTKSAAVFFPPARRRQKIASRKATKDTEQRNDASLAQAFIEGWHLGLYEFSKYKSQNNGDNKKTSSVATLSFAGLKLTQRELDAAAKLGAAIAESTNFARRMIAEPPAYMTPTRLAEEAKTVAKEFGLAIKILDMAQMEKLGMGSILGVARGAKEPAKFIVISYDAPRSRKKIAIVGKGITFDSGGLSLKPAQSMEHMKYDMSGAAVVIGAMRVVGEFRPAVSVIGIAAATENMPGGAALHPGDVLTAMNGKTIEVNNTDAEGRLVLADALTYAIKQGADELIDVATLTGAVVSALGRVAAGIMGSDQSLIDALMKSAEEAGEKLWQLPLYEEYRESLKSDIADLKNAGARGEAASASAGMFLQEFVAGKPWAHLDIAGPAWLDKERDECNKGGTAFGLRTLCRYLLSYRH
ncbi:MAG TPA: leucyl aminopeptidase [Candidatus Obscuribacterales bacterium]